MVRRQNTASGFNGDPVPPGTRNGAAESRKVQRPRFAASSATSSRFRLSGIGIPSPTSTSWCRGFASPSTPDGHHVAHPVAADHRHVPRLQPPRHRGVHPRRRLDEVPLPLLTHPLPAPGANEKHVAAAHGDARLDLPSLELVSHDGRAGFQVVHPPHPRQVHQHAAGEEPQLGVVDAQHSRTLRRDGVERHAVVEHAVVGEVRQAIHVRVGEAVVGDAVFIYRREEGRGRDALHARRQARPPCTCRECLRALRRGALAARWRTGRPSSGGRRQTLHKPK